MKDETKAKKAIEKAGADGDSDEGGKQSAASIVERAEQAAERMEKAQEEYAKLVARNEEITAKQRLGGKSDAGVQPEKSDDELSDKEYMEKVLSGDIKESKEKVPLEA